MMFDELQKLRSLDETEINQLAQANQIWQVKCDELQKKLDCCREENKAHLEKIDELQGRIDEAVDYVSESAGVNLTSEIALNDILEGNKDEN